MHYLQPRLLSRGAPLFLRSEQAPGAYVKKTIARTWWRLRRGSAVFAKRYLGFPPGLPDFLIIGAQKSGTSSLFGHLLQHPDVRSPGKKEFHFFDRWYDKGENWYRAQFPSRGVPGRAPFVTGEATPEYLYHPLAPERSFRLMPAARLVVLLRNPVDRAYSGYQHKVANGHERLTFEKAVALEAERLRGERERMIADPSYDSYNDRHYSYLARGRYLEQIRNWLVYYPREQLLIHNAEEFFADPPTIVNSVTDFLGLRRFTLPRYKPMNTRSYTDMDETVRADLQEYFRPHNEALFEFLGEPYDWGAGALNSP